MLTWQHITTDNEGHMCKWDSNGLNVLLIFNVIDFERLVMLKGCFRADNNVYE